MRRIGLSQARMASPHTVSVLRRSNGDWITVGFGDLVQPGEPIRLFSSDLTSGYLVFRLEDSTGRVILEQSVGVNLQLRGWLDITAPMAEGSYRVFSVSSDIPFIQRPRHEISTTFVVSAKAKPPPSAPEDGGILEWLKEGKNLLIALIVLAVILYIPKPRR